MWLMTTTGFFCQPGSSQNLPNVWDDLRDIERHPTERVPRKRDPRGLRSFHGDEVALNYSTPACLKDPDPPNE